MNPFMMPLEEQKRLEALSFARMVVYAVLFGFFITILVFPWGQQ